MSARIQYGQCRELLLQLRAEGGSADDVATVIDAIGADRGWWTPGRAWRREYGRFHLGAEPLATLLYESAATGDAPQELATVDVHASRPAGAAAVPIGFGWAVVRRFPDDDALPWLPDVLALPGSPTVLRYRPGKRCTLRVDHADGSRTFVKVFDDSIDGAAMHEEASAIAAASASGSLAFDVAPSLGWDAALRTYTQGSVAGAPAVGELFTMGGAPLATRMGAAAATLTTSALQPGRRTGRDRQMKRSAKYAKRIAGAFPNLRGPLDELLARLDAMHAADTDDRLRPIHGAPHPHQWLLDGERLGLVDFDGFALGPPELDVATFVTEMEYENADRMPVAAIIDGFRHGYESVAGPLDDTVLRAYVAHKRLAKAQRNARAVRDDNDERAERAVDDALAATVS